MVTFSNIDGYEAAADGFDKKNLVVVEKVGDLEPILVKGGGAHQAQLVCNAAATSGGANRKLPPGVTGSGGGGMAAAKLIVRIFSPAKSIVESLSLSSEHPSPPPKKSASCISSKPRSIARNCAPLLNHNILFIVMVLSLLDLRVCSVHKYSSRPGNSHNSK